tara:strand:- start:97 stop:273 length:177 start_codon:yes stop_codon:yes gene_type:complete
MAAKLLCGGHAVCAQELAYRPNGWSSAQQGAAQGCVTQALDIWNLACRANAVHKATHS